MKNPLLVPELRDMIASNRLDDFRDFCASTSPEVAAEFLGALTTPELKDALALLDPPTRGTVFAYLDDDARLALVETLDKSQASDLMAAMPDELRVAFLERLSEEQQAKMETIFEHAPPEEAQPLLENLEEAREKPEPEEMTAEEIAAEVAQHLEFFRVAGGRVESIPHIERGCWVNIVDPTKENLPLIAEHFKIPLDFLTSSLDIDETARIEVDQGATLFVVKVPYFDENNVDVLYFTIPIGIILVNGLTITVCSKKDSVLRTFINNQVRNPAVGHRFILQVVFRATLLFLQHLKQLNNTASVIQKKLEQESRNQQLIKLFNIEKSLVYFTTSLKSNLLMLERLRRLRGFELNEENEDLLEDTLTECKQAIEMANIYSDILSGMMDAFASVISNNLNLVMRLLTSITIVITIPVLVTGFFGMNVSLPFEKEPHAHLVILGICIVLCLSAITYFRRKRWLE